MVFMNFYDKRSMGRFFKNKNGHQTCILKLKSKKRFHKQARLLNNQ